MPWNYSANDKLAVFAVIVVTRALGENLLCIISFSHMECGLFTLQVQGEGVTEYRLVLISSLFRKTGARIFQSASTPFRCQRLCTLEITMASCWDNEIGGEEELSQSM